MNLMASASVFLFQLLANGLPVILILWFLNSHLKYWNNAVGWSLYRMNSISETSKLMNKFRLPYRNAHSLRQKYFLSCFVFKRFCFLGSSISSVVLFIAFLLIFDAVENVQYSVVSIRLVPRRYIPVCLYNDGAVMPQLCITFLVVQLWVHGADPLSLHLSHSYWIFVPLIKPPATWYQFAQSRFRSIHSACNFPFLPLRLPPQPGNSVSNHIGAHSKHPSSYHTKYWLSSPLFAIQWVHCRNLDVLLFQNFAQQFTPDFQYITVDCFSTISTLWQSTASGT